MQDLQLLVLTIYSGKCAVPTMCSNFVICNALYPRARTMSMVQRHKNFSTDLAEVFQSIWTLSLWLAQHDVIVFLMSITLNGVDTLLNCTPRKVATKVYLIIVMFKVCNYERVKFTYRQPSIQGSGDTRNYSVKETKPCPLFSIAIKFKFKFKFFFLQPLNGTTSELWDLSFGLFSVALTSGSSFLDGCLPNGVQWTVPSLECNDVISNGQTLGRRMHQLTTSHGQNDASNPYQSAEERNLQGLQEISTE